MRGRALKSRTLKNPPDAEGSGKYPQLTTFWLVLGYHCNNRCSHCYATPSGFVSPWMPLLYAEEVMQALKKEGAQTCLLIGGEPTLYPKLCDLVSLGAEIGLKMVVVSNGRRFKDVKFTSNVFEAGLDRAVISIEGADAETHNLATGKKSFEETCQGIENCAAIGRVNTLTTICQGNCDQIENIISLAYQLGAGKTVLNCAIPVVFDDSTLAENSLNPSYLAKVVERVFRKIREKGLSFQLNATFPLCLLEQSVLEEALKLDWLSVGCHMYRGKGVIFDPIGNILPCTHFSEMPLYEATMDTGNHFILKDSFEGLWQDSQSEAGKFRAALWRYPAERCKECEYWGGCVGGCPLLWTHFEPRDFIDKRR